MMVQDGEESSPEGLDVSIHATSLENPVAEPETTVPGGPDVGVSVRAPTVPEVAVKVALAESLAPIFVVTVTVYEDPGDAPDDTVKLAPVSSPAASAHEDEVKRPLGDDVRVQVVPI